MRALKTYRALPGLAFSNECPVDLNLNDDSNTHDSRFAATDSSHVAERLTLPAAMIPAHSTTVEPRCGPARVLSVIGHAHCASRCSVRCEDTTPR